MLKLKTMTGFITLALLAAPGAYANAMEQNPWKQRYADRSLTDPAPAEEETYRITYGQAREAIAEALESQNAGQHIRVTLPRRDDEIIVSNSQPITAEVDQLSYDSKSHTWQATLYFTADKKPLAPASLSGRFEEIVSIPMLKHRVGSGETISAEDIEMRPYAEQRIQKETVTDIAQVVGKAPKRTISAGRPIREDEVVNPPVVIKGDSVSLIYKTPAMEIRTIGEALENGAEGDNIKIRNDTSHIVVQATITGKGMAQVVPLNSPEPTILSSRTMP